MQTAHGIFALTSFFHSGLESTGGETRSSLTVKETQQLIGAEVRTRPRLVWPLGSRQPRRVAWLGRLPWGIDVAVAAVLVLAVVGAVPQYRTWFHTYIQGRPGETVPRPEEPLSPAWSRARSIPRLQWTKGLGGELAAPSMPLGTALAAHRGRPGAGPHGSPTSAG